MVFTENKLFHFSKRAPRVGTAHNERSPVIWTEKGGSDLPSYFGDTFTNIFHAVSEHF